AAILFPPAILLYDEKPGDFHAFVRRKAVLAPRVQTLAAATYDGLVVARVDDARLTLATGRASQR
ncbi:MAG: hypothetical protein WAM84_11680, partial [Candidatus Cybelea sp.]